MIIIDKSTFMKKYADYLELSNQKDDKYSRYFYFTEHFDISTYSGDMAHVISGAMVKVIKALLNRDTFEFIEESKSNYYDFILYVNIFDNKNLEYIDWGTSIRGAWINQEYEELFKFFIEFVEESNG